MALAAPSVNDMFAGLPAEQRVDRFEAFKSAMSKCHADAYAQASRGEVRFERYQGIVKSASANPASQIEALRSEMTTKAMSPEAVAEVQGALDRLSDIQKDWTLSNPLNTTPYGNLGLVPYDLDPALALLVPRSFILRNSISRIGGIGQAKEYRRITGVSNSNTGGVANLSTFFSSATASTQFGGSGGPSLQRPNKISYAADRHVVSYVEQGVSDEVFMEAQYAGQGYTDLRQLSHTAALWAHMLGEERNLLYSRSSGTGYVGALATPVVTSANLTKAAATTTGGTFVGGTDTVYFKLTYSSGVGESVATAEQSQAVTGSNNSVTLTFSAIPAAALATNVYFGTTSGTYTNKVTFTSSSTTLLTAGSGSYTAPSSDGSANSLGYDGLLTVLTDSTQSGYTKRLNAALSTTEPGAEFQDAFGSLYASVIADPEMIITTGAIRRELAKSIQTQGNPTGYRLNLEAGSDGVTIGSVVSAIANEYTGRMVDVVAHPYAPAGSAIIWSKTLPFPDSGISETTQVVNVTDMNVIEWPVIQMSYDISTYQYGTMIHRAPAWSGSITGIQ